MSCQTNCVHLRHEYGISHRLNIWFATPSDTIDNTLSQKVNSKDFSSIGKFYTSMMERKMFPQKAEMHIIFHGNRKKMMLSINI